MVYSLVYRKVVYLLTMSSNIRITGGKVFFSFWFKFRYVLSFNEMMLTAKPIESFTLFDFFLQSVNASVVYFVKERMWFWYLNDRIAEVKKKYIFFSKPKYPPLGAKKKDHKREKKNMDWQNKKEIRGKRNSKKFNRENLPKDFKKCI